MALRVVAAQQVEVGVQVTTSSLSLLLLLVGPTSLLLLTLVGRANPLLLPLVGAPSPLLLPLAAGCSGAATLIAVGIGAWGWWRPLCRLPTARLTIMLLLLCHCLLDSIVASIVSSVEVIIREVRVDGVLIDPGLGVVVVRLGVGLVGEQGLGGRVTDGDRVDGCSRVVGCGIVVGGVRLLLMLRVQQQ